MALESVWGARGRGRAREEQKKRVGFTDSFTCLESQKEKPIFIILLLISSLRAFRRAREGAAKGRSSWGRRRWPDAKIEGTGAKCDLRNERQREKREESRERREEREERREMREERREKREESREEREERFKQRNAREKRERR